MIRRIRVGLTALSRRARIMLAVAAAAVAATLTAVYVHPVLLLGVAAVGLTTFVLLFGNPGRYENRTFAWFQWVLVVVDLALCLALMASLLRVHVPLWVGRLILAANVAVIYWRLALYLHERRRVALTSTTIQRGGDG